MVVWLCAPNFQEHGYGFSTSIMVPRSLLSIMNCDILRGLPGHFRSS